MASMGQKIAGVVGVTALVGGVLLMTTRAKAAPGEPPPDEIGPPDEGLPEPPDEGLPEPPDEGLPEPPDEGITPEEMASLEDALAQSERVKAQSYSIPLTLDEDRIRELAERYEALAREYLAAGEPEAGNLSARITANYATALQNIVKAKMGPETYRERLRAYDEAWVAFTMSLGGTWSNYPSWPPGTLQAPSGWVGSDAGFANWAEEQPGAPTFAEYGL